ncbi:hypothetical protein cypCar_00049756, partial [Cyprinus carpio]
INGFLCKEKITTAEPLQFNRNISSIGRCMHVMLTEELAYNESAFGCEYTEALNCIHYVNCVGTNMVHYLNNKTCQDPHVLVFGDKENSSQVFIIFIGEAFEKET